MGTEKDKPAADTSGTPEAPRSAPYNPPHRATVGRIVHYYEGTARSRGEPFAALIAAVHDDDHCTLVVYGDGRAFGSQIAVRRDRVRYSEKPTSGCWTWQPRV